jgi:hypothetical protein
MDIGKAFSYPFEDEKWLSKLFLGAIISAVPILNFAWTGYTVDIVRNVSDGVSLPLPDWSEFGDKFVKGFLIWAAGFIYSLPALIVICVLSLIAIPTIIDGSNISEAFLSAFAGISIILACLLILYFLLFSFYFPAVFINFARKDSFGSCFEVGEIIRIVSANTGKYLTAWLVYIVGAIIVGIVIWLISILLSPIICLGWILAWLIGAIGGVYIYTIFSHLFGQVSAEQSLSTTITETEDL